MLQEPIHDKYQLNKVIDDDDDHFQSSIKHLELPNNFYIKIKN
jgi:hypothetical protein